MSNLPKKQVEYDNICRNHSARSDRELYRICPAKLSKRELEELYFALVQNNLELKKNLNGQQERIKALSTKVHRMTATQKSAQSKETRECCVATKALANEQKESMAEMKLANERMAERIRLLNMRLCSAKQFLRSSPSQVYRCNKCLSAPPPSVKNSASSILRIKSAINIKDSDTNLKADVSSQYSAMDAGCPTTRSVDIETDPEQKPKIERLCDENKCRTLMEELKQKVANLENELMTSQSEYCERTCRLEREAGEARGQRSVATAHAQKLQQRVSELMADLRAAEANCNLLTTQLAIEKRKVAELQTQLKAAMLSNRVAQTIGDLNTTKNATSTPSDGSPAPSTADVTPKRGAGKPSFANDSGYMESRTFDDKGLGKLNDELMKKVADLESKLDHLKLSTTVEIAKNKTVDHAMDSESSGQGQLSDDSNCTISHIGKNCASGSNPMAVDFPTEELARQDSSCKSLCSCSESVKKDKSICSYGKKTERPSQTVMNKEICTEPTATKLQDQHNKLQIPGPLPVEKNFTKKEPKKPVTKPLYLQKKTISTINKTVTKPEVEKQEAKPAETEFFKDDKNSAEFLPPKKDSHDKSTRFEDANDPPLDNKLLTSKDSIAVYQERFDSKGKELKSDQESGNMVIHKDSVPEDGSSRMLPRPVADAAVNSKPQTEIPLSVSKPEPREEKVDISSPLKEPMVFCESQSRVCTCSVRPQKDVSVFRTCSGTLRFTTTDVAPKMQSCDCGTPAYEAHQTNIDSIPSNDRDKRRQSFILGHDTYSIPAPLVGVDKQSRPASPDNTEREISSMTDLPSERDAKSRSPRSPGEDKATTTYTESSTTPDPIDYGSLSEGELPAHTTGKRRSLGEKLNTDNVVQTEPLSKNMELTLRAISEELKFCKHLLLSQRPKEVQKPDTRDVAIPAPPDPPPIELHRVLANRSIVEVQKPKCVFLLHIGAIVLSDEAVVSSRNKTLVLMWKFYNQTASMTRMHAGRVVLFDFSTEYDVEITDDFLDYMKHEEMTLKICDITKPDSPFAICVLPLRDALLHTNTRADMSLALIAGPLMRGLRGMAQPVGDEVGVLDLWCELRADLILLPVINSAIAQPSAPANLNVMSPRTFTTNRILQQVQDDESSSGNRLSQDLEICPSHRQQAKRNVNAQLTNLTYDAASTKPLGNMYSGAQRSVDEIPQLGPPASHLESYPAGDLKYDMNKFPMENRASTIKQVNGTDCLGPKPSGILLNQINCKIKSGNDVKQALEENLNPANVSEHLGTIASNDESMSSKNVRLSAGKIILGKKLHRLSSESHKDVQLQSNDWAKESSLGYNLSKPDVVNKKSVTISSNRVEAKNEKYHKQDRRDSCYGQQYIEITVQWLALNEECAAMSDPRVQRLYVAYSFLGRCGAELETPVSLPKPRSYVDKCCFNFTKRFNLNESDLPMLGHMARCRSVSKTVNPKDCIQFSVISEPPEDPLGLENCEDIGYAYLFLGDLLAYSGDSPGYTEVIPVRAARGTEPVCGVLAVCVDGLEILRKCMRLAS